MAVCDAMAPFKTREAKNLKAALLKSISSKNKKTKNQQKWRKNIKANRTTLRVIVIIFLDHL